MRTLLVAVLMVHSGHVTKWHSDQPIPAHNGIQLERVTVNRSLLVMGDKLQAATFMYGAGLAIRFDSRPRKRFTIRASSVRNTTARLRVTYWIVKH